MSKSKWDILFFTILILIIMSINLIVLYQTEIIMKPVVKDKLISKDFNFLYRFYINPTPSIENNKYLGFSEAPINLVAYLDITSESSQKFILNIFPKIKKDFIDKGLVKFYAKNQLMFHDYLENNQKSTSSKYLFCFNQFKKNNFYDFYFDLFEISNEESIKKLLIDYNIDYEEFKSCLDNVKFQQLKESISESENFGIRGINARFYIGVNGTKYHILDGFPSYRKFNRTIREFESIIGN